MYLLFVDESGTHGGSHSFIEEYELHASELRNARKPKATGRINQPSSVWAYEDRTMRLGLLDEAYEVIRSFKPHDAGCPPAYFGVVVDRKFKTDWTAEEREQFAYEILLNKFDVFLKRLRRDSDRPNKGLVIHDRRLVAERDIQSWTAGWRLAAGKVGQVRNLADVPLFADSRASRLLQAADLIAYCLYRRYDPERYETKHFSTLWSAFEEGSRELHGCVHFTPHFGSGSCICEPCFARQRTDRAKPTGRTHPRRRNGV